jgi:hypothetical protein
MPFNESSFKKATVTYKNGYQNYIDKISLDNNITECNKLFFLPNNNFGDSSHLYHGAYKATNNIFDCVTQQ